jgi:hypothetical protein
MCNLKKVIVDYICKWTQYLLRIKDKPNPVPLLCVHEIRWEDELWVD